MNYNQTLVLSVISLIVPLLNVWLFYSSVRSGKNTKTILMIFTIQAYAVSFVFFVLIVLSLLNKFGVPSGFVLLCGQVLIAIPILLSRLFTILN
jgi:hypothetical protein